MCLRSPYPPSQIKIYQVDSKIKDMWKSYSIKKKVNDQHLLLEGE